MPVISNNPASEAPTPGPSEAPVETPSIDTPVEETPSNSNFDFLGMPDDDDFVEVDLGEVPPSEEPAPSETPPPATEVKGEEPKKEEAPKEEAPPAQTEKEPEKQEPAPVEATPPSQPAPAEQKSLVDQLIENRDGLIDQVAQERFAISEEDKAALELDPASFAPKLMARAYYEATVSTITHINNMVPQIVQQVVQQMNVAKEAESAFYEKHSALKPAEHGNDVAQFAQILRQQNPQMSGADLEAMVVAAVMAKHGLSPVAPKAQEAPPTQPKPQPYTPAPNGAPVRVTQEPLQQFDLLGMPDVEEA